MDNAKPKPVWGATAIAAEIGVTTRQAYWMLEAGTLPARKVGNRWVADADKLHAFIRGELEAA
jgi:hypothetical protein